MSNVSIRQYHLKDKDSCVGLMEEFDRYIESIDNLKRLHYDTRWPIKAMDNMSKNAQEKNGAIFVAENNGIIVGFVEGHQEEQSEESLSSIGVKKIGRINELFVTKDYRSQHIGTMLMDAIEGYFKENGFESIFLGVFAPNKIAKDFYLKHGYTEREIELIKIL